MRSIRGWLEHHQALVDVSVASYGVPHRATYRGLIDTGATRTCIARHVIAEQSLAPRGKLLVGSAGGAPERRAAYAYSLGLFTENEDRVRSLYVIDHEFIAPWFTDNGNFDVLVGMDILSRGTLTFRPNGEFSFDFDF